MFANTDTFLKIIDREKDECSISKWVSFLINPNNTTIKVIEKLLMKTVSEKDKVDFVKLFNDPETKLNYIRPEEPANGRVDIMVQFNKFWIMIENKVDANETGNQSVRYEQFGNAQDKPVKYILLKPNYNQYELKNENFVTIYYNEFADILREISKKDLRFADNYIYLQEFIRHADLYLTEKVRDYKSNITSDENKLKIVDKIREVFDMPYSDYETHRMPKYNCIQVWKKGWSTKKEISNHKGVHYEIVFLKDFDYLCEKGIRVYLCIHNESMNGRIPKTDLPKSQDMYNNKYDFDTEENAEKSINEIVTKLKEIADDNDKIIDSIIEKNRNKE